MTGSTNLCSSWMDLPLEWCFNFPEQTKVWRWNIWAVSGRNHFKAASAREKVSCHLWSVHAYTPIINTDNQLLLLKSPPMERISLPMLSDCHQEATLHWTMRLSGGLSQYWRSCKIQHNTMSILTTDSKSNFGIACRTPVPLIHKSFHSFLDSQHSTYQIKYGNHFQNESMKSWWSAARIHSDHSQTSSDGKEPFFFLIDDCLGNSDTFKVCFWILNQSSIIVI
jgi:hypothetical protein